MKRELKEAHEYYTFIKTSREETNVVRYGKYYIYELISFGRCSYSSLLYNFHLLLIKADSNRT